MKRMIPIVLGILAVSASAFAQDQAAIDKALLAAPGNLKAGATVIKWKADYHVRHVEEGHEQPGLLRQVGDARRQQAFYGGMHQPGQPGSRRSEHEVRGDRRQGREQGGVRCRREGWHPREARVRIGLVSLMGADAEHTRTHMTIAVPGATTQSLGLPDNNKQGGVWIMNAGTTTAHLMTPGE